MLACPCAVASPSGDSDVVPEREITQFPANLDRCIPCAPSPEGDWWRKRGLYTKEEVFLGKSITYGSDDGSGNFSTPFAMDAAAPKGAPRRPQLPDFLKTVLAPPCPARGPEAGSAHMNCKHFTDLIGKRGHYFILCACCRRHHVRFHGSGVNFSFMPVSPEQFLSEPQPCSI